MFLIAIKRALYLRKGAISIETAPDRSGLQRSFAVHTTGEAAGAGRAAVRCKRCGDALAVTEGAVEVTLRGRSAAHTVVPAGQQTLLTEQGAAALEPVSAQQQAWVHGMLMADALPLADVVAALSRYRSGILQCAPEVAGLRVSGAYPLTDTDSALAMLQAVPHPGAPARLRGHWVTLVARGHQEAR